ncbi:MAG: hypothetical protein CMP11_03330 [Zetaproteobacteria bacterium]|nr:hypothetical protein [Pseudobdellovibrionaceae bacterium]|tara:strand:- start:846 stop:1307 length:462 start_codon:yes stop_codon:yes gene_type:complete
MNIWIDGDACPKEIKEVVFRAAIRTRTNLKYIANSYQKIPKNELFQLILVDKSFDAADQHIIDHMKSGDLVITSDIPLAYDAVRKNAFVINPKGEKYTEENIREKKAMRDLFHELRSAGVISGGSKPLGQKEINLFANAFDRTLQEALKLKNK